MRIERRSFLEALIAVPSAGLLQSRDRGLPAIGLQLFTIQSELDKDFDRTLDRVAAMGYREVEFAGYSGHSAQQVRSALRASGLVGPSNHTNWATLGERWTGVVETAQSVGHEHLIITALDRALRTQPDIWSRAADQLNRAGDVCRAAGIKLGYHNHLFEFARIDGHPQRAAQPAR